MSDSIRVLMAVAIAAASMFGAPATRSLAQTSAGDAAVPSSRRGAAVRFQIKDTLAHSVDSAATAVPATPAASAASSALMLAARELTFVAAASLPPGATHAMLRTDPETGGIERFIRFPPGIEIAAHWHSASETVLLLDGDATVAMEGEKKLLAAGSYFFFPARTVHVAWIGDAGAVIYQRTGGPPDRHLVSEEGASK